MLSATTNHRVSWSYWTNVLSPWSGKETISHYQRGYIVVKTRSQHAAQQLALEMMSLHFFYVRVVSLKICLSHQLR